MYKDKMSVVQVLGCILHNPTIIIDEQYPLSDKDFPERFHKVVFVAMENLVKNGINDLSDITIDDFLVKYPKQHKVFTDYNGLDYLSKAYAMADVNNFEYYYNTLRKYSLLNQLESNGFDVSLVYDDTLVSPKDSAKMQSKFDDYSVEDILNQYEISLSDLKDSFCSTVNSTSCQAAKGMSSLKEKYKEVPEMGMPLGSQKMTTVCRGRRLKKLYLKTAPSGFGKTRISVGDACCLAIPQIWDSKLNQWVFTNCCEPTLFITTELEIDEIQTLIMAYVSDVPEDHILDGKYQEGEEDRVDKAIEIIANSKLYIEHMPNFNIDDIEATIKKYKIKKQITYVFFDYIFTSIKILSEVATKTKGVRMREDNVLLMFADRMKTLANVLNIHIDTSSQANGDWKNVKDGDANLIAGAKSMANKVDVGFIILPPSEKDKASIKSILQKGFHKQPNLVYHIYKIRRGKLNHIKVWIYFDYGTCRTYDLFATNNDYKLLDVENTSVEVMLEDTEVVVEDNEDDFSDW